MERADDILAELGPLADFLLPPATEDKGVPGVEEDEKAESTAGGNKRKGAKEGRRKHDGKRKKEGARGAKPGRKRAAGATEAPLSAAERKILEMLSSEPRPIDDVIAESGLSPQEVSSHLLVLEIKRLVRHMPGNMYTRAGDD